MYSRDELFMRFLKCYLGVYFAHWIPEVNTKLTLSWAHKHFATLQWRQNERDGVSNHQPYECLLNRWFKAQIKDNIKAPLRVTDLCEGNLPVTDEFPAQKASNAENVSIWWRHRGHWIPYIIPSILSFVDRDYLN